MYKYHLLPLDRTGVTIHNPRAHQPSAALPKALIPRSLPTLTPLSITTEHEHAVGSGPSLTQRLFANDIASLSSCVIFALGSAGAGFCAPTAEPAVCCVSTVTFRTYAYQGLEAQKARPLRVARLAPSLRSYRQRRTGPISRHPDDIRLHAQLPRRRADRDELDGSVAATDDPGRQYWSSKRHPLATSLEPLHLLQLQRHLRG